MLCYQNGYFLIICSNMSFALHLKHGCDKSYVIRGCTISRVVSRADGYYISRDVSRAAMVTIIKGRVARRDRCMDRYVPIGLGLSDSGCVSLGQTCIIILDIAFHCNAHSYH